MRSLISFFWGTVERRRPVPGRPVLKVKERRRPEGRLVDRFWPPAFMTRRQARRLASSAGALLMVAAILKVTGVFAAIGAGWSGLVAEVSRSEGLTIQNVTVYGRQVIRAEDVMAALGVQRGEPILGLDVEAARQRLQALPWAQSVSVERRMPNTLIVSIVERRPMALWQVDGRMLLVDQNGIAIEGEQNNIAAYAALPLLVGDDAPAHAAELLELYTREPALAQRVQAAIRVSKRRWNLKFTNGIEVRMPETDLAAAWQRLANLDRQERLLSRDVVFIDLRQADRLIVRLNDGGERRIPAPGKNT